MIPVAGFTSSTFFLFMRGHHRFMRLMGGGLISVQLTGSHDFSVTLYLIDLLFFLLLPDQILLVLLGIGLLVETLKGLGLLVTVRGLLTFRFYLIQLEAKILRGILVILVIKKWFLPLEFESALNC